MTWLQHGSPVPGGSPDLHSRTLILLLLLPECAQLCVPGSHLILTAVVTRGPEDSLSSPLHTQRRDMEAQKG